MIEMTRDVDDGGDDRAEIIAVLRAYHAAMVAANTKDLDRLVADGFTLVHITDIVQPTSSWFDVVNSGQFDYHRIDVDDRLAYGVLCFLYPGCQRVLRRDSAQDGPPPPRTRSDHRP